MDFISLILWPIKWVIELILVAFHSLFEMVGLPGASGLTWVLTIVGLVLIVRAALIPLFVRQIKNQRKTLILAPDLKRIQDKYKNKKDQYSRQAMQREMMALYGKHGTSPMASCLPLLAQMPIFFGLFQVLNHAASFSDEPGVGLMTAQLNRQFADADIFGAPLSATFINVVNSGGEPWQVLLVAPIMVVIMTSSQFLTQLQIMSKNISDETKASPTYRTQKIMLYILPLVFLFSGAAFPLGVMVYWLVSNFWTMGQQYIVIKNMPNPGSEAERQKLAREARKRERKGLPPIEETTATETQVKAQRVQPVSKNRAKKQGKKK